MGRRYYIGDVRFYRRSHIKVSAAERAQIKADGIAQLRRPVEWPLAGSVPDFSKAYPDPGNTEIWGPGPYLKVPHRDIISGGARLNRVFCPWGYPPDRIRVARSRFYLQLTEIELAQSGPEAWDWLLGVGVWLPAEAAKHCG